MKTSISPWWAAVPVVALLLVGVVSVAYSLGSNAGSNAHINSAMASSLPSGMPANPRIGAATGDVVVGTVASKTSSTIVVSTTAGKTATVDVSATTRYLVRGVASATLANVAVGDRIVAQGTLNSDGSLTATVIQTGTAGAPGLGGRGFGGGSGRVPGGGRGRVPNPAPSASGPTT